MVRNKCTWLSALSSLLPLHPNSWQEGTFSHTQKEKKAGLQSSIHNSKLQKALKTKTFFLSLPQTHLAAKLDQNGCKITWGLVVSCYEGSGAGSSRRNFPLLPHTLLDSAADTVPGPHTASLYSEKFWILGHFWSRVQAATAQKARTPPRLLGKDFQR